MNEENKSSKVKKPEDETSAIAKSKEMQSNVNNPSDKKMSYYKDGIDNINDRRTGETYDKDRVEGFYKNAEMDGNDVNPYDVRDNERPLTNQHITPVKTDDTGKSQGDEKLQPDDNTIEKDKYNKDNDNLKDENLKAHNKAGEDYNSSKNK